MIQRFDHAVIGVSDLEAACESFERLGFEVSEGGRHPSLGTRNAIVRFGLDYLELLTVEYPAKAKARGPFGGELVDYLTEHCGLVGFVLAGTDLQQQVDGFRRLGMEADGPFEMDRIRPDGRRLEWRLVLPGRSPWRRPWPYLIDWITKEADLLAWDPPGNHACGVTAVTGIDLVVKDLNGARQIYDQALGLGNLRIPGKRPTTGVGILHYRLENLMLGLHQPMAQGPMSEELDRKGPGPYRLTLSTPDMTSTVKELTRRRIPWRETSGSVDIDPTCVLGVRLRISPA